jgi:hypothetical protein
VYVCVCVCVCVYVLCMRVCVVCVCVCVYVLCMRVCDRGREGNSVGGVIKIYLEVFESTHTRYDMT